MHVERGDRTLPDAVELKMLELFADHLSRALDVASRVDLVESAVEQLRVPVLVLDHRNCIRFANLVASQQLKLQLGWQLNDSILLASVVPGEVVEVVTRAQSAKHPLTRYIQHWTDSDPAMRLVHASPLLDWRKCYLGSVVSIRNMKETDVLRHALKAIATCREVDDLADKLLSAVSDLGHWWSRFYFVDRTSERLVGYAQHGSRKEEALANRFAERSIELPQRGVVGSYSWLCFDRGKPLVLSYCTERKDAEEYTTELGLTVLNVKDQFCPDELKKTNGARWVDIPLISRNGNQPLAKLSVVCFETLTPEHLSLLQIIAETASAVLASIIERQDEVEREGDRMRQAMLQAIGETSHQMQSKLASLVILGEEFAIAKSASEIVELEREWRQRLGQLQDVLDTAKQRLKPIQFRPARARLDQSLGEVLRQQLGREKAMDAFFCGDTEFTADFDEALLNEAVEELIANARKAIGDHHLLEMKLTLNQVMQRERRCCRIDVWNNGPPIPLERRSRIFDDFFSEWVESGSRSTGLGLSRVQSIVSAHHGKITVLDVEVGAGFRIEFPRFREQHAIN